MFTWQCKLGVCDSDGEWTKEMFRCVSVLEEILGKPWSGNIIYTIETTIVFRVDRKLSYVVVHPFVCLILYCLNVFPNKHQIRWSVLIWQCILVSSHFITSELIPGGACKERTVGWHLPRHAHLQRPHDRNGRSLGWNANGISTMYVISFYFYIFPSILLNRVCNVYTIR